VNAEAERDALRVQLDRARSYRLAKPSEAIDRQLHTARRIGAYLVARGWTFLRDGTLASFWEHPEHGQVSVFHYADAPEYPAWASETVQCLADKYGAGELGVLADIAESADA
jgi:hypothetical protein